MSLKDKYYVEGSTLKVHARTIPKELKRFNQWVCWKIMIEEKNRGKTVQKVPVNPRTGGNAKSNDRTTWGSFHQALNAMKRRNLPGIGFVCSEGDPFVGIDLDEVRNPETGEISAKAKKIIKTLNSYTEISPSGTGIHIFAKGKIPKALKAGFIEIYDQVRFFTMTGHRLKDSRKKIFKRSRTLAELYEQHNKSSIKELAVCQAPISSMEEEEILKVASRGKNGQRFKQLFGGAWGNYPSRSEADFALCCMLASFTHGDSQKIDQIFRMSKMMRPKWDERHHSDGSTYGEKTIVRAVALYRNSIGLDANQGGTSVKDTLPEAPISAEMLMPGGYSISAEGVFKYFSQNPRMANKGQFVEQTIATAPVLIQGRLKDTANSKEYLRLTWLRDGKWQTTIEDRGKVLNHKRIDELIGIGFPMDSIMAKDMVRFLSLFENANKGILACSELTHQLGWQGKMGMHGFLWGYTLLLPGGKRSVNADPERAPQDVSVNHVMFKPLDTGDEQMARALHKKGRYDEWKKAVELVKDYPKVTFAFYASLASPLLQIIAQPNFIVDWAGKTSTGKTTALIGAASIWGNPKERDPSSLLRSHDATRVYAERVLETLGNLPLFLDETQRAHDQDSLKKFIYDSVSGQGRGRGTINSTAQTKVWRTIVLSTGEVQITDLAGKAGGAYGRILQIWGPPFGEQNSRIAKTIRAFVQCVTENYGHAGPRFVRYLQENAGDWNKWIKQFEKLRARYEQKAENIGVKIRISEYMAVIHLTAKLAEEALNLQLDYSKHLETVWEDILISLDDADQGEQAHKRILSDAIAKKKSFWKKDKGENLQPAWGWLGIWGKDQIAFVPSELEKLLNNGGYDPKTILKDWKARGWLDITEQKGFTKKGTMAGESGRYIYVKRQVKY